MFHSMQEIVAVMNFTKSNRFSKSGRTFADSRVDDLFERETLAKEDNRDILQMGLIKICILKYLTDAK